MGKEKKRKLSLGDIIRKMNESAATDHRNKEELPFQVEKKSADSAPGSLRTLTDRDLPTQPQYNANKVHAEPLSPARQSISTYENDNGKAPPEAVKEAAQAHPSQMKNGSDTLYNQQAAPPANQAQTIDNDDEEEFDLFRYLNVIIRRKEIIILTTIALGIFYLISYLRSNRYYTAKARLLFKPFQESIIDNRSTGIRYGLDRERSFNTHLELLKSNTVLERVADNMENTMMPGIISAGLNIKQGVTDGEDNDIIELRYKHRKAETARNVLNELCKTYLKYIREVNAQEDTRLILKLKTQIDKVQIELTEKESALSRFKENNRMVELSKNTNLLTSKLANMELALQQTQLDLLESKERLTTLKSQIGQQEINVVQSMTYENPMRSRLAELELELNTLSGEYSPDHFKIKQIKQQIDNLKQAMQTEIEKEISGKAVKHTLVKNPIRESLLQTYINQNIEISAFEAKRTAQEQIIEKLNNMMRQLPSLEQKYAFLQRETESLVKTLKMLKMKLEETKIKRDSKESDLKILEIAELPKIAISNKKLSSVIIGVIIGLIIGIILAFLFEYLDQSLKDPAEIEQSLELPLIGIVPLIEAENAIVNSKNLTKSILEPFRALRTNIKHIISQHNSKTFMVCSAIKGEGKTTLAINLAITFSMDGKKVIIVDCDLRRSQIHSLLNISKILGLSDYLTSSAAADAIIKPTIYDNLFVITSGERPHNPAELLGTPKFETLLQELKSRADIIICDSPALIPVSDSMTMAPYMDHCIMVVRALWTPTKAAKQAKNQLVRIGAKIGGGILNGISHSRGYYPYYYGYYGYYAYKYSYDYDKEPRRKFTIREFGLSVERKIKDAFKNIPLSLPRFSATGLFLFKEILKRPFFWLLLLMFSAVLIVRFIYFANTEKDNGESLITYIGGEKSPDKSAHSPIIIEQVPDYNQTKRDCTSIQKESISGEPRNQSDKTISQTVLDFAYAESLSVWMEAFNAADTSRLFTFYDPDNFEYPGGRFNTWRKATCSNLLKNTHRDFIITIDPLSSKTIKDNYIKTVAKATVVQGVDTLEMQKTMIWRRVYNRWRIIREKSKVIGQ